MSLLGWNYRGLGTDVTVGELRWIMKKYHPQLLFLSETKMRGDKASNFMWSLGYDCCLPVSSDGLSGGLVLFWNSTLCVFLQAFSQRIIDVKVRPASGEEWRATFVYGEPKKDLHHTF